MQDVNRGEVAPWVMCGHREGHSKAWPAVRMRGRGLNSNLFVTLPKARATGHTKQAYTLKASSLLDRKSLSVRLFGFDNRKAQGEFVEHPYQLAELAGVSFHRDLAGHDGVREGLLLEQDRIE